MIDDKRLAELADEDPRAWFAELRRRMRAGERRFENRRIADAISHGWISAYELMPPTQFRELVHAEAIRDLGALGAPHPIKAWAICCNAIRKVEADSYPMIRTAFGNMGLYLATASVWAKARASDPAYEPFGPSPSDMEEAKLVLELVDERTKHGTPNPQEDSGPRDGA